MESRNTIGIYLRKNQATVVCLAAQGRERKLLDCFSVSVEGDEEVNPQLLADRIVQVCGERKVKFEEAAVALDGAAFMQHTVQSEFRDPKRIAATVRFDTEEALATDVSDVAVAFRVVSTGEEGANLDVFTAQRGILSEILVALESHGIDPVTVDPDVCCLSRYLAAYGKEETSGQGLLYAALSDCRGYLVAISQSQEVSTLRTFLIGAAQERNGLLARETLVTTALTETVDPVGGLRVFDTTDETVAQTLGEKTGLDAGACDLIGMAGLESGDLADCSNAVDFALAYGAALALPDKVTSTNFRNDHMPFLGKRVRMEKAVRFLGISLTILLLAVGVYFHSQLLRVNHYKTELQRKFEPDYLAVMFGEKRMPTPMKAAVNKLESALRHLRAEKMGTGDHTSVSAKLTLVLQAVHSCARQTDLNVESISITGNSIIINGDTSNRQSTLRVFAAMKSAGLKVLQNSVNPEGRRDGFTVTVEPEKRSQGA